MQVTSEIESFLRLVAAERPRVVLELGTARGGTLFLLTQVASDDAVLIGVDMPEGRRSFGGNPEYHRRRRFFESFARAGQRVVYVPLNTHRPETLSHVRDVLADRDVDLLFVDGDHSAAGVAADYELYAPLVRTGGLVAFHDIAPGPPDAVGGVPEFWQTIRTDDATELVEDWSQGGWGIGVLRR
jgi:predicted O-methyltransferase YrrM